VPVFTQSIFPWSAGLSEQKYDVTKSRSIDAGERYGDREAFATPTLMAQSAQVANTTVLFGTAGV
jgi:hypothetical protein